MRVGALTVGAAPRPDLVATLRRHLGQIEIVETGALDGIVRPSELPPRAADGHPIETRLADGTRVVIDEGALTPRVQAALGRLEAANVAATVILCAGGFELLHSSRPLIRPFEATAERLRSEGVERIALVVPFAEQAPGATARWAGAGFDPIVVVAASVAEAVPRIMGAITHSRPVDRVVLDYVGHSPETVASIGGAVHAAGGPPVVDIATVAAEAAARLIASASLPA
jgi:hypothetical protein